MEVAWRASDEKGDEDYGQDDDTAAEEEPLTEEQLQQAENAYMLCKTALDHHARVGWDAGVTGFLTLSDELSIGRDNHDRYTGLSASAPLPPRWFRDQAVIQPRDGGRGRRCIHAGGAVRLCGQAAR
jgi:hypothetical protein